MVDPFVFIVESPNPSDIADGRSEGQALSASLNLAGIENTIQQPKTLDDLQACFSTILDTLAPFIIDGTLRFPLVHFSAHGNEQGIGLTDGDFVPWATLANLLFQSADEIKMLDETDQMAAWLLSFSTCHGAHAYNLLNNGTPYPCGGLVGPTESVSWQDSLTAFVTYFHLMLTKKLGVDETVNRMNLAAGLPNTFRQFTCPAMTQP